MKTQARHAIELIADYHLSHDDEGRAGRALRAADSELLDVIKEVLYLLTVTTDAYVSEKGRQEQADEIVRLREELAVAKGPQTDLLERANKRIGALQQALDMPDGARELLLLALESSEGHMTEAVAKECAGRGR